MPGERMSDYFPRFRRRPGGTSAPLRRRIGGFNSGANQGPQGIDTLRSIARNRAARHRAPMAGGYGRLRRPSSRTLAALRTGARGR